MCIDTLIVLGTYQYTIFVPVLLIGHLAAKSHSDKNKKINPKKSGVCTRLCLV